MNTLILSYYFGTVFGTDDVLTLNGDDKNGY